MLFACFLRPRNNILKYDRFLQNHPVYFVDYDKEVQYNWMTAWKVVDDDTFEGIKNAILQGYLQFAIDIHFADGRKLQP